jgi:1-acyl-sn-glycerol-3-phosphate acyltransferase
MIERIPRPDGTAVKALLARRWLRARGWRCIGSPPDVPKYVIVAAPHTSNWDFAYMYAYAKITDTTIEWLGKHTLFEGQLGKIPKALGGVPVDRTSKHNLVDQIVQHFEERDRLALVVPPEGTRSRSEYWKSGFYHIARGADVPIALGIVDFGRREVGFGPSFRLTGDVKADMDRIRAFYAPDQARYPQNFGPIRLRAEEEE